MSNENSNFFISDTATVMPGAYIGLGVIIEDNVIIGPNAVILGKDKQSPIAAEIRSGAKIGPNATILAGVSLVFFL